LRRLAQLGPVLQGSLVSIRVRCGHPRCRCARGQPHRSYLLTTKVRGKTQSLYIPRDRLPEVRLWVQNYRRAKQLLQQISRASRQLLRATAPRRRQRASRGASAPRST